MILLKLAKYTSTLKPPKLVKIKVNIEGDTLPFAFPLHTKLAKNLQKAGVPLQFECGFACQCSTCSVEFTSQDFNKIAQDQPIGEKEKQTLKENNRSELTRLSCQLYVMDYFEGIEIKPQLQ